MSQRSATAPDPTGSAHWGICLPCAPRRRQTTGGADSTLITLNLATAHNLLNSARLGISRVAPTRCRLRYPSACSAMGSLDPVASWRHLVLDNRRAGYRRTAPTLSPDHREGDRGVLGCRRTENTPTGWTVEDAVLPHQRDAVTHSAPRPSGSCRTATGSGSAAGSALPSPRCCEAAPPGTAMSEESHPSGERRFLRESSHPCSASVGDRRGGTSTSQTVRSLKVSRRSCRQRYCGCC